MFFFFVLIDVINCVATGIESFNHIALDDKGVIGGAYHCGKGISKEGKTHNIGQKRIRGGFL